jgi:hypothetical protein
MRLTRLLPLAAAALGLLPACHTITCTEEPTAAPTGLVGRWELVSRTGGMVPSPTLPQEVIEFAPDSTVRVYRNSQLLQEYRFRAVAPSSFCTNLPQPYYFVRFKTLNPATNLEQLYVYQLQGNELVLDGNVCVDGTQSRYRWQSTQP